MTMSLILNFENLPKTHNSKYLAKKILFFLELTIFLRPYLNQLLILYFL